MNYLEKKAIRIDQNDKNPLYLFALTGKELAMIAEISRLSRDDVGILIGYQRPEVKQHVQEITEYLDNNFVLFPNSIILAITSRIKFKQSRGPGVSDGYAKTGTIEIPLGSNGFPKPAWIVDGQQRVLALSKCKNQNLPIPVNAFVADEVEIQRDQFLRINNTKPLPRGLITELLPEVSSNLPSRLSSKKIPAVICETLSTNKLSPFHGIIKRASTPKGNTDCIVISDNSIVKMIEESLMQPSGCLFPYRNIATSETDLNSIIRILELYWTAVSKVFNEAWGKPPTKSRLMHGAGIRSMGRLMDKIIPYVNINSENAINDICAELSLIADKCKWCTGRWEEMDNLRWDQIQNVPRHINILSNIIIRYYLKAKGNG